MRKFIKLIKEKWLRQTSKTLLLMAIILVIFLLGNKIIESCNFNPIDFTKEKIYSLTEESKNVIKDVESDVNIYFFGYNENSLEVSLGKQYTNVNNKINIQVLSVDERPDLVAEYEQSSTEQFVAVSSNGRYKIIDYQDMYISDESTQYTLAEQKLTNAIVEVTIAKKPQIYFLTGHGEYGIDDYSAMSTLSKELTNEVNDVNSLYLLSSDIPEICDVLVIVNPVQDFTDIETEKIKNYINNGGNIIWLQDPYSIQNINQSDFANVNQILSLYGISFSSGIVLEQSNDNMVMGAPNLIVPEVSYNSITKNFYTDGILIMGNACKINNSDYETMENLGVTASPFIQTTDQAYCKENIDNGIDYNADTDELGEFVLGEVLEKEISEEKKSTLVAISNTVFASDNSLLGQIFFNFGNNGDVVLDSVAYLSNREDAIRIKKSESELGYIVTEKEATIVRTIVITIPIVIIVLGTIILIVRKRRHK